MSLTLTVYLVISIQVRAFKTIIELHNLLILPYVLKWYSLCITYFLEYAAYKLIKANAECEVPGEVDLGDQPSRLSCAAACRLKEGCRFFIYGYKTKDTYCYWEKPQTPDCDGGQWDDDTYDFYEIIGILCIA